MTAAAEVWKAVGNVFSLGVLGAGFWLVWQVRLARFNRRQRRTEQRGQR